MLQINGERLWSSLMELAAIGAYVDERSGLSGVNRLSLTDDEAKGRHFVMSKMEAAGLEVRVDAMGNVFGRRNGSDPSAAPVLMGSHIDTVATAGAFDGCLGVLGGIEVMRALDEAGITTRRPIEVAFFTEEEGVRFGVDMLGSAVLAGRVSLAEAHDLRDRDGVRLGDELVRHGFDGDAEFVTPHAYLECHIEQGPILAAEGVQIGVVTGVQGISWQRLTIDGRAAHAGTTPMELRVDAGLAAAEIIVKLRAMADSGEFGDMRSTVGHIEARPGLTNIVPQRSEITVDLRNPDNAQMARAEAELEAFCRELERRHPGLQITSERLAKTAHVSFDQDIQDVVAKTAAEFGLTQQPILSGAGHDAQELAAVCPSGMVFIPGEYDGISHNPREYSTPQACTQGINVLANAVLELAS